MRQPQLRFRVAAAMGCAGLALLGTCAQAAPRLTIDTARSHVEFGVRVLWFGKVVGVLQRLEGTVHALGAGRVRVDVRVDARALRMQSRDYERLASGPGFFDSAQYPDIEFRSAPFALRRIASGGPVSGQVTLRGITHEVEFQLLPQPCADLPALLTAVAPAAGASAPAAASSVPSSAVTPGTSVSTPAAASASIAAAASVGVPASVPAPASASGPAVAASATAGAAPAVAASAGSFTPQPKEPWCRVLARGYIQRSTFGMRGHRLIIANRVELGLVLRLQAGATQSAAPAPASSAARAASAAVRRH
jgi:polyisoprenoid-binding protein YceI